MAKNNIIVILTILLNSSAFAENYFIIYFKDKSDNQYSISKPNEFLTSRAILRRQKEGVDIHVSDLPVSQKYIDTLMNRGINIKYVSKWLNCALVYENESALMGLNYQFFDSYSFLARKSPYLKWQESESSVARLNTNSSFYGESFTQSDMLNIDSLHAEGFTGAGNLVALFDEGFLNVDTFQVFDELRPRIIDTYDFVGRKRDVFDKGKHGAQVLSTLAGKLDGKLIGPSYGASFLLYHTEDAGGESPVEEFYYLLASERADSLGVDIVSTSLGYRDFDNSSLDHSYEDLNGRKTIASIAVNMLAKKGVIVVVSAGNTGNGSFKTVGTPADADSILTVGAVDDKYMKTSFSSTGPTVDGRIKPDVSALGDRTVALDISSDGNVTVLSGTSLSTPIVAGFVSLIKEKNPQMSSQEIIKYVKESSSNAQSPNNLVGHGVPYYGERDTVVGFIDDAVYVYSDDRYLYFTTQLPVSRGKVEFMLYTPEGKSIAIQSANMDGNNVAKISLNALSAGPYIAIVRSNDKIDKRLFIKK